MPLPRPDRAGWIDAGGDGRRYDLLAQVGTVAGFAHGGARCLAAVHPDRTEVGTIADWVGAGEAAATVLQAAEAWLAELGCVEARGPMWMTPWFDHGANLGPHEASPLHFETAEAAEPWAESGYDVHATYASILAGHEENIRAGMNAAGKLASRGWSLQPLDVQGDFASSVQLVHGVLHQAHRDMPGYTDVPLDVWAAWFEPQIAALTEPVLSRIAVHPSGQPVGYVLAFPEPPAAFSIPSLAVVPEHQKAGLASWMVATVHQAARKAGIEGGIHAMVRYGVGTREDTTWYRGNVVRRYALYSKTIR